MLDIKNTCETGLNWLGVMPSLMFCEHFNKCSGSIKSFRFLIPAEWRQILKNVAVRSN
jgi:hypothetical protein